jgi:23S rRNA (adenine2030-N6)-methyltransferase
MPYTHYGEIGDIWKHVPLCSFLAAERPLHYVETNAAFPEYPLDRTERRNYGIFHLLQETAERRYEQLDDSPYMRIAKSICSREVPTYFGSPGLAMELLQERADYLFYDIEEEPLAAINEFSERKGLKERVRTKLGDSIEGLWVQVERMDKDTFLHIDPYRIFETTTNGRCYFDLFAKAMRRGIKTMLWYGYETIDERRDLHERIRSGLTGVGGNVSGIDFRIESIGISVPGVNPGVPGCGILIANLSPASESLFETLAKRVEAAYRHAIYMNQPASLIAGNWSLDE